MGWLPIGALNKVIRNLIHVVPLNSFCLFSNLVPLLSHGGGRNLFLPIRFSSMSYNEGKLGSCWLFCSPSGEVLLAREALFIQPWKEDLRRWQFVLPLLKHPTPKLVLFCCCCCCKQNAGSLFRQAGLLTKIFSIHGYMPEPGFPRFPDHCPEGWGQVCGLPLVPWPQLRLAWLPEA